jgi:hypothetical protein
MTEQATPTFKRQSRSLEIALRVGSRVRSHVKLADGGLGGDSRTLFTMDCALQQWRGAGTGGQRAQHGFGIGVTDV